MDDTELTESQKRVVQEIQRVANLLGVNRLSKREFDKHHEIAGLSTAGYQFGSWNRAVRTAGLEPYESGASNVGPRLSEDELLKEIIRLHRQLGMRPAEREMARFGNYSPRPYKDRWGRWTAARDAAYEKFGEPDNEISEAH